MSACRLKTFANCLRPTKSGSHCLSQPGRTDCISKISRCPCFATIPTQSPRRTSRFSQSGLRRRRPKQDNRADSQWYLTNEIFETNRPEGTPVSSLSQENFAAGVIPRLSLLVTHQMSTSCAVINREHVSLIFRSKHLFQETELAAWEGKQ